jgi:hypothetical protein
LVEESEAHPPSPWSLMGKSLVRPDNTRPAAGASRERVSSKALGGHWHKVVIARSAATKQSRQAGSARREIASLRSQ